MEAAERLRGVCRNALRNIFHGNRATDRAAYTRLPRWGKGHRARISPSLEQVLTIAAARQEWYIDYAEQHGFPPLPFVGIAATWDPVATAAAMRETLHFDIEDRPGTYAEARRKLIHTFENLGGLVIVNSMVGDNTRKPLDTTEFRGFSLVHATAPLVFVNSNQAGYPAQTLAAQIFTLAHEFAHVWRGEGGVGNHYGFIPARAEIENWCDHVATEFLVPRDDLRTQVADSSDLSEHLPDLAARYKASTFVVLYAARNDGIIGTADFRELYVAEENRVTQILSQKDRSRGGDMRYSRRYRVGERFMTAVASELAAGRILPTEALSLTGIKSMSAFDSFTEFLQKDRANVPS